MFFYYRQPVGDATRYKDACCYAEIPSDTLEGFEWVEGVPPNGASPVLPLGDQLEAAFLGALEIYGSLMTVAERAGIFQLKTSVNEALKYDEAVAKYLIQQASLPDIAEIKAVQDQMVSFFP